MKILVTGGCGFIGSHFLHYMIDKYNDYEFVCLDALTYAGNYKNIESLLENKNFKFIHGNICDKELVNNLFINEKFDIVVNFAAESNVDHSIENPSLFYETNVIGTLCLLEACVMMNDIHKIKRFHQVSTDEVYGDIPLCSKFRGFKESSLLKPSSPYSSSKASADLLVMSFSRTFNLDVSISRTCNNYGPSQHDDKLIPIVIEKCLHNEDIPVHGSGLYQREWIYVLDNVRAIDLIIHNECKSKIYNVGSGVIKSNMDIVKFIVKVLKGKSKICHVEDRKGQDLKYKIDSSIIREEFGFKCNCDFNEYLMKTILCYNENKVDKE